MATKDDEPRVNGEITTPLILLIDENNQKRGVIDVKEAIRLAESVELDLVEVAPQATPPVCRIMNYGKYRFQQQKRDKDAKKKQKSQVLKEIKMRPKIDQHDYDFKVKAVKTFLSDGDKVKVSIFFRGREMAFLDRGRDVIDGVVADVMEFGKLESEPRMEGSYMRATFVPIEGQKKPKPQIEPEQEAEAKNKQAKPQKAAKAKKQMEFDADKI